MTRFQILVRKDSHPGYIPAGVEEAHSAEQAVKAAYLKKPDGEIVEMCAVPKRSWNPTPIRTEQVTKVVLGLAPDDERKLP